MLFTYKDKKFAINKEELYTYRGFRKLIDRDIEEFVTGSIDSQSVKECLYIYHVVNPDSIPNKKGYTEKETHDFALKQAKLPIGWVPDETVLEAMDTYAEYVGHAGVEPIIELRRTFTILRRLIVKVRTELDAKLDAAKLSDKEMNDIVSLSDKILTISTQIPKKVDELATAERLLQAQLDIEAEEQLAGGGKILRSMEDNDIDN